MERGTTSLEHGGGVDRQGRGVRLEERSGKAQRAGGRLGQGTREVKARRHSGTTFWARAQGDSQREIAEGLRWDPTRHSTQRIGGDVPLHQERVGGATKRDGARILIESRRRLRKARLRGPRSATALVTARGKVFATAHEAKNATEACRH